MNKDTEALLKRLQKEALSSAKEGVRILEKDIDKDISLRTAANQLRQAAKDLDTMDGIFQALYWEKQK
jgi:hypothetical protein